MIEIDWGKPLHFTVSPTGDTQKFTTIEQARYWLRSKWPVDDEPRLRALERIDAAMECIGSVGSARRAFIQAGRSAGFELEQRAS